MKKSTLSDGTVQTLCDVVTLAFNGGTWSRDGVIVFSWGGKGLYRVSSSGGTPTKLPVEGDYRWPSFLPDGHHLFVLSNGASAGIFVVVLEGGPVQSVLPQDDRPARYVDPGYILFARRGNLSAQQFDLRSLQTTGSAVTVATSAEPQERLAFPQHQAAFCCICRHRRPSSHGWIGTEAGCPL